MDLTSQDHDSDIGIISSIRKALHQLHHCQHAQACIIRSVHSEFQEEQIGTDEDPSTEESQRLKDRRTCLWTKRISPVRPVDRDLRTEVNS